MNEATNLALPVFEAVFNFRDLGGTPVSEGRALRRLQLFRSGTPDRMLPHELDHLLHVAPLRNVIDLRGPSEPPADLGPLPTRGTRHHFAMWDDELDADEQANWYAEPVGFLTQNYAKPIERFGDQLARAVTILGAPDAWPTLVHCGGGKDRTGLLTALILDSVDVDEDDIVGDYLASESEAQRAFAWFQSHGVVQPEVRRPTIDTVQEPALRTTLAGIRSTYGPARAFLEHCGTPPAAIDTIQVQLVH